MNEVTELKRFLDDLNGKYEGIRIFIGNNSLAAFKFISSMQDFSYRRFGRNIFEFYGMERPSDRASRSKYLDGLTGYIELFDESPENSFKSPKVICQGAVHFDCQFVWPGWGHSSEDPSFPRECKKNGLIFIGPSEHAMDLLGSKISANKLADSSGIPSIPWIEVAELSKVQEFCRTTGFPIMVKSPEGGGGKGIRIIESEDELLQAIATVQDETGSKAVFVTKYLRRIKHIEIQVVADRAGNYEVVSTRDCTIQRRNQKLIEEGPSIIDTAKEKKIAEMAGKLVNAAEYHNACTVEFVLDLDTDDMFFLECNPRLQVEHTVTDLLTDNNLCSIQWLISCGATIPRLKERGILKEFRGHRHVVGARVIAESAECKFIPSSGKLSVSSSFQSGTVGYFSVDSGAITPYNDSQFGHVFGIGETRDEAISALRMALSSVKITGEVKHLNNFLSDLINTDEFKNSQHTTRTAEVFQEEWVKLSGMPPFFILSFCAISADRMGKPDTQMTFQTNQLQITAKIQKVDRYVYAIEINGGISVLEILCLFDDKYRVKTSDNEIKVIYFSKSKMYTELHTEGKTVRFTENLAGNKIHAPVPGRIVKLLKEGSVEKDEEYLEIESMKNLIRIKAPKGGVLEYKVRPEEIVEIGDILAEISGGASDAVVCYTEQLVYKNTQRDLTLNLFKGYNIPTELQSFDLSTMNQAIEEYTKSTYIQNSAAVVYIISCLVYLLDETSETIIQFKNALNSLKQKVSNNNELDRTDVFIHIYKLQQIIYNEEIKEEIGQFIQLSKEETIKNAESIKNNQILLIMAVNSEKVKMVNLLGIWIKKVFNKSDIEMAIEEGNPTAGVIKIEIGKNAADVFYLIKIENAQHDPIINTGINIAGISEKDIPGIIDRIQKKCTEFTLVQVNGLCVEYIKYSGSIRYSNINVFYTHTGRLPMAIENNPDNSFQYALLDRKVFVHSADDKVIIYCVLSKNDIKNNLDQIVNETLFGYKLFGVLGQPLILYMQVMEELEYSDEMDFYFKEEIPNKFYCVDDYNCTWHIIGYFNNMGPFILDIQSKKGFREVVLTVDKNPIFYRIGDFDIKNTKNNELSDNLFVPSQYTEDILCRSRARAKSLNTICIYDAALLLSILIKEVSGDLRILPIENKRNAAMFGWRFTNEIFDFVFIGNDITAKNGAFSIDEDNYFTECANISVSNRIPFIYVSSNSGAKIEVLEMLKPMIKYENNLNIIYMEKNMYDSLTDKQVVDVSEREIEGRKVYEIIEIIGVYGMGVENLSYSAQVAKSMAILYKEVPTLTYATGRAVGIGAYLASIGGRIIQKEDSPIILTGYNALNSLLQKEIYKNNLDIGGPSILEKNGVVHKAVTSDLSGLNEVLKWLQYIQSSDKSNNAAEDLREDTYDEQVERFTAEEIVNYISDTDGFTEYLSGWAPNVQVGRTKIQNISCGVIFPRTGTVHQLLPAPEATNRDFSPSAVVQTTWTENVLFSESAKKIALAINDFTRESIPILILLNWKGFSAGHLDMFNGVLQNGSEIVKSMEGSSSKIFTYLPPSSELRGGSWVVFDKKIGNKIRSAAHPTAKGSVIHPDGLSKIKCKQTELASILKSSNIPFSKIDASKLAKKFCALHDSSTRMIKMDVIDEIIPVFNLRESVVKYFRE
ncbi:acetyl-CoA carboxylase / biotin carboxylase 1 [Nematocida parisii]|nr:acetyl-CoA carboxylase / biotin carboxylase 1 [Nematocida parisii]